MKKVIFQVFVSMIFLSCNEEITVVPESKTDLLTKQKWNIYKYTIGTLNTPTRSISQLANEGSKGQYFSDFSFSYIRFKSDGTYSKLDGSNAFSENYLWKWAKNDTEIELQKPGVNDIQTAVIDKLDTEKLTLHYYYTKGVTSDLRWELLAKDLRSHGFGVGFTEIYIIEEFVAQK